MNNEQKDGLLIQLLSEKSTGEIFEMLSILDFEIRTWLFGELLKNSGFLRAP